MNTGEIVRKIITAHEENEGLLSKSLAVLSHRPFNMKGQEIEEILGLILQGGLKDYFNIKNPKVEVPQNKQSADIKFHFSNDELRELDIKSYGGAERLQISTLKDILQDIRNKFLNSSPRILDDSEKNWLIDKLNGIKIEYNLSFLSFARDNEIVDVQAFDLINLSIERFKNLPFQLKIVGKEKRVEIYLQITEKSTLEVSAGGNPLNRGMWINKIRNPQDMELIYQTGFITKIFNKQVRLSNFDKNKYIFEKARLTLQLIKEQF
jgi:hypothetical protein